MTFFYIYYIYERSIILVMCTFIIRCCSRACAIGSVPYRLFIKGQRKAVAYRVCMYTSGYCIILYVANLEARVKVVQRIVAIIGMEISRVK